MPTNFLPPYLLFGIIKLTQSPSFLHYGSNFWKSEKPENDQISLNEQNILEFMSSINSWKKSIRTKFWKRSKDSKGSRQGHYLLFNVVSGRQNSEKYFGSAQLFQAISVIFGKFWFSEIWVVMRKNVGFWVNFMIPMWKYRGRKFLGILLFFSYTTRIAFEITGMLRS